MPTAQKQRTGPPMTVALVDRKLAQAARRLEHIAAEGDAEKGSGIARRETLNEADRLLDVRLALTRAAKA